MTTIIDESLPQSFDPLALLRPLPGSNGVAGASPDSESAPKVSGGNVFIWLSSAREKAIALEEIEAGLRGDNERPPDAEPPARLWERIFNVTHRYLREYGKDIRIALYCLEAWIRRDGLTGLGAGLELVRGLVAAYWETLHPLPFGDSGEDRRIDCLLEYYASRDDVALEYSPLFFAMDHHIPVATSGKAVWYLHDVIEKGGGSPNLGRISDNLRDAAAVTPPEIARSWLYACRHAIESCVALERLAIAPEFISDGIPFPTPGKLRRRLEEIEALLSALYPYRTGVLAQSGKEENEAFEPGKEKPDSGSILDMGHLESQIIANRRTDNLRILRVLGQRFQATEPHSPVGYAIVHWTDMAELPLPKLLDAMGIMGNGERMNLQIFAGVRAPENNK